MKIEYPDDFEIEKSVDYICEKGEIKKDGFFVFLRNMTQGLGIANVFYGIRDAVLLAGFIFVLMCVGIMYFCVPENADKLFICAFALAPAVFIVMFLLSYIKEKTSETYQVKMSCKYTVNHLLAYRMFVFSLAGAAADTVYVLLICMKAQLDFIALLCVSLSALFLFSLVLIFTVLRFNSIFAPITVLSVWIVSNGLLWLIFGDSYGIVLQHVPVWIYILLAAVSAVMYINRLGVLSDKRRNVYVNG